MRIAIVGAGIAGLGSAWLLQKQGHAVTLFEANDYLGGHTHTVDVTLDGLTAPVDTGFLVFNDRTYPHLVALFDELGVASVASEMSFSARIDAAGLEWAGTSVASLFAQPRKRAAAGLLAHAGRHRALQSRNHRAARARRAVVDLARRVPRRAADSARRSATGICCRWRRRSGRRRGRTSSTFRCRRSCASATTTDCCASAIGRNGGRCKAAAASTSRRSPRGCPTCAARRRCSESGAGAHGVEVEAAGRVERFDEVVLACHSDQARRLLADRDVERRPPARGDPLPAEPGRAAHRHRRSCPARAARGRRGTISRPTTRTARRPVAVTYLLNKLQPLPFATPVIVTLNPPFEPDPALTLREFEYSHPLQDGPALDAQSRFAALQGLRHTWYAGAWLGHGFHEDGLKSAHAVAAGIARLAAVSAPMPARRARRRLTDRCTPHGPAPLPPAAAPRGAPRALSVATPAIIHGEVTHRRSRPARHAFTYPAFCLRLPLSQLADARALRHRAQPARRRFVPRSRSRPLRRQPAPALDPRAARRRGRRGRRRDRPARVSAHAGIRVQSGELLGLPRPGRRRARGAVRGPQHVRRAPLYLLADADGARSQAGRRWRRARSSTFRRSATSRAATRSASISAPSAGSRASTISTPTAASRCSRRGFRDRRRRSRRPRRADLPGATACSRSASSRASTGRRCSSG